uniref:Putative psi n=1 Tax=Corethrella appendiculata TaxID=1370023 RepID=U5EYN3_9DIPT
MSDYSQQNQQFSINQSSAFQAAILRAKEIAAKIQPGTQPIKRSLEDGQEPDAKKFSSSSSDHHSNNAAMQAAQHARDIAARLGNSNNSNSNQSQDPVQRARDLISKMVNQGNGQENTGSSSRPGFGSGGGGSNYPPYVEIPIPGPKVGLIIGKGGETIKQLQEKTGAKMVIIQDGPGQEMEKPLRISGDPQKVEHAKQLVYELIQEKNPYDQRSNANSGGSGGGGGGGGGIMPGAPGGEQAEVFVPKSAVGVVIGKGGEMLKKIQGDSGCKLQFIQGRGDSHGDRRCIVQGTKPQVEEGKRMIEELVESVLRRENQGNQNRNGNGNPQDPNYPQQQQQQYQGPQVTREEYTFTVPASKCGILIGRGGDTIKQINQQSGAHCEMDRKVSANQTAEKTFTCKGESHQIEEAKRLICEKINVEINMTYVGSTTVPANQVYGNQNGVNPYQGWGYTPQWDQSSQQAAVQPVADYSQQWIEYYKQMGMHREAEMIEQQVKTRQGQPSPAQPQPAATQAQSSSQTADYSAEWAEYYRRIGKVDEAEAIEKQIATTKVMPNAPSPAQPGPPFNQQQYVGQFSQQYQNYQGYGAPYMGPQGGAQPPAAPGADKN